MQTFRLVIAATLAGVALAAVGCGGSDDEAGDDTGGDTTEAVVTAGTPLKGAVGPGFDISLQTESGESLTTVEAGSYELEIEDLSSIHNFHLSGPAVDISTDVAEEGTQNVTLDLQPGTHTFVCDPHAPSMNGSFEVAG